MLEVCGGAGRDAGQLKDAAGISTEWNSGWFCRGCDREGVFAFPAVVQGGGQSGNPTPCRMTGVTVHSHFRYKGI